MQKFFYYNQPKYITADPFLYKFLKPAKDRLKSGFTESEKIMWQILKKSNLGFKFRRQYIVDQFIVDFICIENRLIIEIDGSVHNLQKEYDLARTEQLIALGYNVIRFSNGDVKYRIAKVKETILKELKRHPF